MGDTEPGMGERKVLCKYFPPDFDPGLLKKYGFKKQWMKQIEVRMMLPFNIQCIKCGEYMYRGKKFNSKKEDVDDDDMYLGIKKFRFHMKCSGCGNVFSIKTDPENGDYEVEIGCKRLFEVWKKTDADEEPETDNKIESLEKNTLAAKQLEDSHDAIDFLQARNDRNSGMDLQTIAELKATDYSKKKSKDEQVEDASLAKKIFSKKIIRLQESQQATKKNATKKMWCSTTQPIAPPPPIPAFVVTKKKNKKKKKNKNKKRKLKRKDKKGESAKRAKTATTSNGVTESL